MGTKANINYSLKLIKGFTIPTRPMVMLEAIRNQNTFFPKPKEVAATIVQDMALAATVLKAANTLLDGYSRKVDSIPSAVVLLGEDKLRQVTHELFLSAGITGKESLMQKVRSQGIRTAQLLAWLSQAIATESPLFESEKLPPIPRDAAYVAGLLHDCGQLVLLQKFPDYANLLSHYDKQTNSLIDVEMEHYRTNHAMLGSMLCNHWQLPRPLTQIIEAHHHIDAFAIGKPVKERKFAVIHALLFLAQWIEGEISTWEWQQGRDYFCQFFQIDHQQANQLQQQAQLLFPASEA